MSRKRQHQAEPIGRMNLAWAAALIGLLSAAPLLAQQQSQEEAELTQQQLQQEEEEEKTVVRTYDVSDLIAAIMDREATQLPKYPFRSDVLPPNQLYSAEYGPDGNGAGGGGRGIFGGANDGDMSGSPVDSDNDDKPSREVAVQALTGTIRDSVAPDDWRQRGGPVGSMSQLRGTLIITHTPEHHEQIQDLLQQLRDRWRPRLSERPQVSIRARWLRLEENAHRTLLPVSGETDQVEVPRTLDAEALAELGPEQIAYEGAITCFDGQTVHVAGGRGRTVVIEVDAVVGESASDVTPTARLIHLGPMLELTPSVAESGDAVVVDLKNIVSEDRSEPQAPADERTASAVLDRLELAVQQFATTLELPLGEPTLVGGMTMPRDGQGTPLYLVLTVNVSD